MDTLGVIKISFSKAMVIIPELVSLSSNGITMTNTDKNGRILKTTEPSLDIFTVTVLPGGFSDIEDLGFEWKVTKFTSQAMTLKVDFAKPLSVSSSPEND